MKRRRPKRGERQIDAATEHLAQHGFAKPQIHKVIDELLQLYGREGWPFLEEGSYRVVLDKLLEEQAQQDQKHESAATEQASPQNGMEVSRVHGEAKGPPCAGSPCYGWISEESETESESEDGEMLSDAGPVIFTKNDIPNPVETLPSNRK